MAKTVPEVTYGQINDEVMQATRPPRPLYWLLLALLAGGVGLGALIWLYQVLIGMGAAALHHPVDWGVYIANFVFWVGIAHSGTLISAILYLFRAKWRDAVSRSSEAMTIFAVLTAGLFPLIHLGRVWVFYYILPYPSQRQIWPNFTSPLVWDVLAVFTYFTVSLIFFYVGLIPDFAAGRDHYEKTLGPGHWRSRLYRGFALGWSSAASQWRHYGRSYLFFAALATPLVISVHSVVSWDFAMSLLTGWHTTMYAPYFVTGAIHSGLAMVLALMIPMRRLLKLQNVIRPHHFEQVAKTTLVTTLLMGYFYLIEPFIAWYTGEPIEIQYISWRAFEFGWPAGLYWTILSLNAIIPLAFAFKKVRTNQLLLLLIAVGIVLGMWLERLLIVPASLAHDFMPHNWTDFYAPNWVSGLITFASFCLFFGAFLSFAKFLPTVPITELKTLVAEQRTKSMKAYEIEPKASKPAPGEPAVLAVFGQPDHLLAALHSIREAGFRTLEVFSPVKIEKIQEMMGHPKSPVRIWTLVGALTGMVGGYFLAIGTAVVNSLIVGGKPPVAPIPYAIPAFEGTILLGSIANLTGMIVHARLYRNRTLPHYDPRFTRDKFGLLVAASPEERDRVESILRDTGGEEIHVHQ